MEGVSSFEVLLSWVSPILQEVERDIIVVEKTGDVDSCVSSFISLVDMFVDLFIRGKLEFRNNICEFSIVGLGQNIKSIENLIFWAF